MKHAGHSHILWQTRALAFHYAADIFSRISAIPAWKQHWIYANELAFTKTTDMILSFKGKI